VPRGLERRQQICFPGGKLPRERKGNNVGTYGQNPVTEGKAVKKDKRGEGLIRGKDGERLTIGPKFRVRSLL